MRSRSAVMASCVLALSCAEGRFLPDAAAVRRDGGPSIDAREEDARTLDAPSPDAPSPDGAALLDVGLADTPLIDARNLDASTPESDASRPDAPVRPDACVALVYYPDRDGDGHGVAPGAVSACVAPAGFVRSSDDCNDADGSIHPGAIDGCNGIDQDCAPGESCPSGCRGATYGSHDYAYCPTGTSWTTARDRCASTSMQLVRIDSSGENAFVGDLGGTSILWIGANDRSSEGNFVWIDGASIASRHWTTGYPDGSGDCARMNTDDRWVDTDCTRTYDYVCESR